HRKFEALDIVLKLAFIPVLIGWRDDALHFLQRQLFEKHIVVKDDPDAFLYPLLGIPVVIAEYTYFSCIRLHQIHDQFNDCRFTRPILTYRPCDKSLYFLKLKIFHFEFLQLILDVGVLNDILLSAYFPSYTKVIISIHSPKCMSTLLLLSAISDSCPSTFFLF